MDVVLFILLSNFRFTKIDLLWQRNDGNNKKSQHNIVKTFVDVLLVVCHFLYIYSSICVSKCDVFDQILLLRSFFDATQNVHIFLAAASGCCSLSSFRHRSPRYEHGWIELPANRIRHWNWIQFFSTWNALELTSHQNGNQMFDVTFGQAKCFDFG